MRPRPVLLAVVILAFVVLPAVALLTVGCGTIAVVSEDSQVRIRITRGPATLALDNSPESFPLSIKSPSAVMVWPQN